MLKAIGLDKIILILLFAGFAAGGYFYNSSFLTPSITKQERSLRSSKGELNKITQDTNRLVAGLELFEEQRESFAKIQEQGFFDDQSRGLMRARLDAMGRESGLEVLRYTINPAIEISNEKLKDAKYKLLETDINFEVGAIDDTDIASFIYLLNHGFPGQVIVNNITMTKRQDITQPLLRNIGLGRSYDPLISGTVNVTWSTMVPDTSLDVDAGEGQ